MTGAFFAESVAIADGKLFVLGGVLSRWKRDPGTASTIRLVLLTQTDGDDADKVPVTIYRPDGSAIETDGLVIPEATKHGHDAGCMIGWVTLGADEPDGRFVVVAGTSTLPITLETGSAQD